MSSQPAFDSLCSQALEVTGSASAAIFLVGADGKLSLAGSAGITGEPLNQLVAAVQSPEHPVTRTASDGQIAFDVTPMAPGGPALRSHLPVIDAQIPGNVIGVVALAHQNPLNADQRDAAIDLARQAAQLTTR